MIYCVFAEEPGSYTHPECKCFEYPLDKPSLKPRFRREADETELAELFFAFAKSMKIMDRSGKEGTNL